MRRGVVLAFACVLGLGSVKGMCGTLKVAETEGFISVENDSLSVTFHKAEKGAIGQIVNKLTGRALLAEKVEKRLLYRLGAAQRDGKRHFLSSLDAKESAISVENKGRSAVVTVVNRMHGDFALTITATCAIEADSPLIRWRARIKNETDLWPCELSLPWVVCTPQLGESAEDDYVMQCACDGMLFENPMKHCPVGYSHSGSYPGGMSAQLLSFQDATGGLYYATHDGEGYMKKLGVRRGEQGMELAAGHLAPREFGADYATSYDTVLGVVKGDWRCAADVYKSWAVTQPWCRKKIVERDDVPQWLKDAPLFYAVSLRGQYKAKSQLDFPTDILDNTRTYHDQLGRPVTAMLMAWERHGAWITPQYFPPFGGVAAFRHTTRTLKARGDQSLVFLSGLKWTLDKSVGGVEYKDQEDFEGIGRASAIAHEGGEARIAGKAGDGVGQSAEICCGTPLAREMILGAVEECQKLGLTAVQADQIVGGGQSPCYSNEHRHKSGAGTYQYECLSRIFADALKKGRERAPDFAFGIEEPNELYNQCINFYHARDYAQNRWPRMGPNVRGVPVFTYLYHEYIIGYGGDSASVGSQESRPAVLCQGLNLVCGKTPGAAVWSRAIDAAELHPDQLKAMKGAAAILGTRACAYLMLGKMLHPLKLNAPMETVKFYDWESKKTRAMQFPAVLHNVFQAADSSGVGIVLFNWTDKEVRFDVPLDVESTAGKLHDLWRYGKDGNTYAPMRTGVSSPTNVQLSLGPSDSVFLELVPAK